MVVVMVIAEIHENCSGVWSGQLVESENGRPIGERWSAATRSGLIATINKWVPLTHLKFRDCMDPLDP